MCGIVACLNRVDGLSFLEEGLGRVASRGYDSWGVGVIDAHRQFVVHRQEGTQDFSSCRFTKIPDEVIGVAHCRWATHGHVAEVNTHPICSMWGKVIGVHNGILTDDCIGYLDQELKAADYRRIGTTDTERLINFFEYLEPGQSTLEYLYRNCDGEFAVVMLVKKQNALYCCAKKMPLWISDELCVASELQALSGYGTRAKKLNGCVVLESKDDYASMEAEEIDIPDYIETEPTESTTMLSEIMEQSDWVRENIEEAERFKPITFFGCGSSYYAAKIGAKFFQIAGKDADAQYSCDLADSPPKDGHYLAITQSGETRDTLIALEHLKTSGVPITSINVMTNVTSSSCIEYGDFYDLACGREDAVASTKTFLASILKLHQMAFGPDAVDKYELADAIDLLTQDKSTLSIFASHLTRRNAIVLGRSIFYPVAQEGALKLKEVGQVHAEAINASEIKHGPLALIDDETPSLFLVTRDVHLDKILGNMREVKARGGEVLAICDENVIDDVQSIADEVYCVPASPAHFLPFLFVVALQIISHEVAILRGLNPDRPRNLAKSVTV